jgi:hypothetical protein
VTAVNSAYLRAFPQAKLLFEMNFLSALKILVLFPNVIQRAGCEMNRHKKRAVWRISVGACGKAVE